MTSPKQFSPNPSVPEQPVREEASARFDLPPLSLYVHIPWCVRKCPYCDFNSHAAPERIPETDYLASLLADLERDASLAGGRRLQSIFFGGGTPSLFSPSGIATILQRAEQLIGFAPEVEITLEANPGTVEQQRFGGFRDAGVNRLSIGIQSLREEQLKALGRIHDRDQALRAIDSARRAGFKRINLDLMHGLPGQTVGQALDDLREVIALDPGHISWYQLTIEQNTVFYRQPPRLPDAEVLADIEDHGWDLLAQAGYQQYEVSAYSQSGQQSRHNRNYWEFGDYLGIGAGAHGKVTDSDQSVWRSRKTRLPAHYMAESEPLNLWGVVPAAELPLEFMMNVLRLTDGVAAEVFAARTGLSLEALQPQLGSLQSRGLMEANSGRLATTELGRRFLNDVLEAFMVPAQD
ncbi:radical SAM family heme chaperone HemW [Proteobacteria bacterium 005FR1]|nr:radical SAM family heme chaperone HemW [Proteobacteria bacterium 005FR1]